MQHSFTGTVSPIHVNYVGQKNSNLDDGYDVSVACSSARGCAQPRRKSSHQRN